MTFVKSVLLLSVVFILGFGIHESFAENVELVTVVPLSQNSAPNYSTEPQTQSSEQTVVVNPIALNDDKMNITVFGESIEVTREKTITRADNDFTYIGSTSDSFENVWIAYYDGVMRIEMQNLGTDYILTPSDEHHTITKSDSTSFGSSNEGGSPSLHPDYQDIVGNIPSGDFTKDTHNNVVIDVIYLYTDQAESNSESGGQSGIRLMGNLGIDKTNNSFEHARIPVELRHVETSNVGRNYVESGIVSTELERLYTVNDGYMERGIALRDRENADIGFLFLGAVPQSSPGNYLCGKVPDILPPADSAFLAINVECPAAIGTVIAHEFGHLAGAYHDTTTVKKQGNSVG